MASLLAVPNPLCPAFVSLDQDIMDWTLSKHLRTSGALVLSTTCLTRHTGTDKVAGRYQICVGMLRIKTGVEQESPVQPAKRLRSLLSHFNLDWTNLLRCMPPSWQATDIQRANALHGRAPACGKALRMKFLSISVSYRTNLQAVEGGSTKP
jgi:hypothetical protein